MPRVKIGPALPDRATLEVEIARLRDLDVTELRRHWQAVFGRPAPPHLARHLLGDSRPIFWWGPGAIDPSPLVPEARLTLAFSRPYPRVFARVPSRFRDPVTRSILFLYISFLSLSYIRKHLQGLRPSKITHLHQSLRLVLS